MSDTSLILGMPYIQPAQAQKHLTHNEALRLLDALVQLSVLSADVTTPPATPEEGDRYLVPPAATGDWTGQDTTLAIWDTGAWLHITPQAGWQAYARDQSRALVFDGTDWEVETPAIDSLQNMQTLGVNATADTTNRLAVSAPSVLLNHEGSDHRLKINKAASTDTASLLFQSGFSGRAEMGLAGSDGFDVRVSNDGASWLTAFQANPVTGVMTLPQGAVIDGAISGTAVLGSVSQTGGISDGALFEKGSNANGDYTRYADGSQVCSATVVLVFDNHRMSYDWTFPQAFVAGSEVSSHFSLKNEFEAVPDPTDFGFVGCSQGPSAHHLDVRLRVFRRIGTTNFATTDEMTAYVVAHGRWF